MKNRLQSLFKEIGTVGAAIPEVAKGFTQFVETASQQEGALSVKTKELILTALGIYNRCEGCILMHAYSALRAGATRKEILEAAATATVFGGGPSFIQIGSVLLPALEAFEKDFIK